VGGELVWREAAEMRVWVWVEGVKVTILETTDLLVRTLKQRATVNYRRMDRQLRGLLASGGQIIGCEGRSVTGVGGSRTPFVPSFLPRKGWRVACGHDGKSHTGYATTELVWEQFVCAQ
jgi:hypothetical protein